MALLSGMLIALISAVVFFYVLFKYKNRRIKPDYYEYYKKQDRIPSGKVGVFITGLIMPETLDNTFFYNITKKIFNVIIPWPFRLFAQADKGIALLDPIRHHEDREFEPTRLEDPHGNDRDIDGEPYIEKYRKGQVSWVPPSKQIYLDHGYFLYPGRKGGMPSLSGKTINRARLWYYGSIKQGKLPHNKEVLKVIRSAMAKLGENNGDIAWEVSNCLFYHEMKTKLHKLLDAGCETIVLSSPMIIYSHFEEFNSSFYHCFEYIHEWEKSHQGKKVKVIIAPPLGHFQPMRQAFLAMLEERLETLPGDSAVAVAITVHGMPWDYFPWEAWLELAPPYRDKLCDDVKQLISRYSFKRTKVTVCQDEFANPIWDPKEKYLSTNRVFKDAVKDGYDYVITLPIEYFAENSDTLHQHAQEIYEDFDAFNVYDEIDYPDWDSPYVREIRAGETTLIYNGLPVGRHQHHVMEALYQSLDSILSNGKKQIPREWDGAHCT